MRAACLLAVVALGCGGGGGSGTEQSLAVSMTFPVDTTFGSAPSYLQKYIGTTLSWEVQFFPYEVDRYHSTEDCSNTDVHLDNAARAVTSAIPEAQTELLDPLIEDWTVSFEWCTDPARSSVSMDSVVELYNLAFGCAEVPTDVQKLDDGYPVVTSLTARRCSATILDIINEVGVGNDNFAMTLEARTLVPL